MGQIFGPSLSDSISRRELVWELVPRLAYLNMESEPYPSRPALSQAAGIEGEQTSFS